jgi:hypothetical protein
MHQVQASRQGFRQRNSVRRLAAGGQTNDAQFRAQRRPAHDVNLPAGITQGCLRHEIAR